MIRLDLRRVRIGDVLVYAGEPRFHVRILTKPSRYSWRVYERWEDEPEGRQAHYEPGYLKRVLGNGPLRVDRPS